MRRSSNSVAILVPLIACLLAGCGGDAKTETAPEKAVGGAKPIETEPELAPLTQAELEQRYVAAKQRIAATETLPDASVAEIEADLRRVANEAEDVHLRANASLLLGSLFDDRNDVRTAISFYRQAVELVPDDADTHIVLALALAKAEKWDDAITEQWIVVKAIPDDLVGWLLLGELHVKAGDLEEAAKVYGAYELRRKGLFDGLTLKKDGVYLKAEADRIACAEALAPAIDNGTALGLMYALDSDPEPKVRAAIVGVMGEQRLFGYKKMLTDKAGSETDAEVKEAITWALAEIEREGVETNPGPVPESIAKQVEEQAKLQAEAEAKAAAEAVGAEKPVEGGEKPVEGAEKPKPEPDEKPSK
jgi:tetratricopeptide (TPR) repeat protein